MKQQKQHCNYKRMSIEEFWEYMQKQDPNRLIPFALTLNAPLSDEELRVLYFDSFVLEDWFYGMRVSNEAFTQGVLIDRYGGGVGCFFNRDDVEENGVDVTLEPFFEQDLAAYYDKNTKLIVEVRE